MAETEPACADCQQVIVGPFVTALGKKWHSEHFGCAHCSRNLGSEPFVEKDGLAYCQADFQNLFFPKCGHCNEPISGGFIKALDKTWHPEHFVCAYCRKPFGEDGFHEQAGKAYCRDDFLRLFATECGGCNEDIKGEFVTALNKQWHPKCFVCTDCKKPFNEGNLYDHDGKPYCKIHYHTLQNMLCGACSMPITGPCINALGRRYHPEHFICCYCRKELNKGTYQEQAEKAYCNSCFYKLFS